MLGAISSIFLEEKLPQLVERFLRGLVLFSTTKRAEVPFDDGVCMN